MLTSLLAILLTGLLAPFVWRLTQRHAGLLLAVVPAACFVWFALQIPEVAGGGVIFESLAWVPALDVALGLRLDGLALLFALLITGIGALIVMYSGAYLKGHGQLGRFYAYLLVFMMAMLGLVLADDLIALFVFWELTSVASYLLISFNHEKAESRRAALQALLITGGGGLALLAGLVLLGIAGGTWQFSELQADVVQSSVPGDHGIGADWLFYQVCSVPLPSVAAQRHECAYSGIGVPAFCDHGQSRYLFAGTAESHPRRRDDLDRYSGRGRCPNRFAGCGPGDSPI